MILQEGKKKWNGAGNEEMLAALYRKLYTVEIVKTTVAIVEKFQKIRSRRVAEEEKIKVDA